MQWLGIGRNVYYIMYVRMPVCIWWPFGLIFIFGGESGRNVI